MLAFPRSFRSIAIGAVAFIGMQAVGTAEAAGPKFDGVWSVSIVTERGDCDRGYRYPIRINKGVLSNAGDTDFDISGQVGERGAITVRVSRGSKSASGTGRLSGNIGGGSWSGGECSGSWTAERTS